MQLLSDADLLHQLAKTGRNAISAIAVYWYGSKNVGRIIKRTAALRLISPCVRDGKVYTGRHRHLLLPKDV